MSLKKEQILAADDLKREPVDMPEWGGVVYVRVMTGKERQVFQEIVAKEGENADITERLVAMTLCDAEGMRLFSDDEITALAGKAAHCLKRLADVATRISKLSADEVASAEKNSESAPSGAFGSV